MVVLESLEEVNGLLVSLFGSHQKQTDSFSAISAELLHVAQVKFQKTGLGNHFANQLDFDFVAAQSLPEPSGHEHKADSVHVVLGQILEVLKLLQGQMLDEPGLLYLDLTGGRVLLLVDESIALLVVAFDSVFNGLVEVLEFREEFLDFLGLSQRVDVFDELVLVAFLQNV